MTKKSRWALLEHSEFSRDSNGIHFDLLLEDIDGCRTWRIEKIPVLDGPSQTVIPLPVHRLKWLDISEGEVSGGRGWARRVFAGKFLGKLSSNTSDPVQIELSSLPLVANLEIRDGWCKLFSLSSTNAY